MRTAATSCSVMPDTKTRLARAAELAALRRMTPDERLAQIFQLSETMRAMLKEAIRKQFPGESDADIHQRFLKRLERCHNVNW